MNLTPQHLMKCLAIICSLIVGTNAQAEPENSLYIASGSNPFTSNIYVPLYQDFKRQTGITIHRILLPDMKLLDHEQSWYAPNGKPLDIINGNASQRLYQYYQQNKIQSLDAFWQANDLDNYFHHLKGSVTFNNTILAIPYSVFSWQIFYLDSGVGENFTPPQSIEQLIQLCTSLHNKGIVPFHISRQSAWSEMAWFEYIILRSYGLDYFNALMSGQVPYTSEKVRNVLLTWKKLIDANCFSESFGSMNWEHLLPYIFRNKVALLFTNNSFVSFAQRINQKDKLRFFRFPKINDLPQYESAPTDAFFVSSLSKNTKAVHTFLRYIADKKIQERINIPLGQIPANIESQLPSDKLSQQLAKTVITAEATSAFIDRLLQPDFERESRQYFTNFVLTGDVDTMMQNLEKLRLKHHPIIPLRASH